MKIGLFDSGIGGTTTMAEIKKLLPEAEYIFIADSKNCPYGEKTDEVLWPIVCHNVDELINQNVDLIVIACNTVTTRYADRLRKTYPKMRFVGTEPAVKVACKIGVRKILVMATPATVASERTSLLVDENRSEGQEVRLIGCNGLANAIESKNEEMICRVLDDCLSGVDRDYEAVVLGCTHYPLIRDEIQKRFVGAKLIDGNDGVARQVSRFFGLL